MKPVRRTKREYGIVEQRRPSGIRRRRLGAIRWLARTRDRRTAVVAAVAAAGLGSLAGCVPAPPADATVTVNEAAPLQTITGFGISEAFGQAGGVQAMAPGPQRQLLDELFSRTTGAGLDMVRLGITQSGDEAAQTWFAHEAQGYGPQTFFADSWGAPASMKTNGSLDNGGDLCGAPGTYCPQGDQRGAYAALLAGDVQAYERAGVPVSAVDFVNEPDFVAPYISMDLSPAQAADFIPYLAGALQRDGLTTKISCCDPEGWNDVPKYTSAILADPAAAADLGIVTGHGYAAPSFVPIQSGGRPVWETEWSTSDRWDPAWDDGSDASGLTWANNIATALTQGDVNAFSYWWGTASGLAGQAANSALVSIQNGQGEPAGRLWAFGQFSRFITPGSTRLTTSADPSQMQVVAAQAGSKTIVVVVNNRPQSLSLGVTLSGGSAASATAAAPYVTDAGHTMAPQATVPVYGGSFVAQVPGRGVATFVVS